MQEELLKRMEELGVEKDEDNVDPAIKKRIVEEMLRGLEQQEYQLKISGRAAAATESERQLKAVLDQLEKVIKMKDYYKKQLEG